MKWRHFKKSIQKSETVTSQHPSLCRKIGKGVRMSQVQVLHEKNPDFIVLLPFCVEECHANLIPTCCFTQQCCSPAPHLPYTHHACPTCSCGPYAPQDSYKCSPTQDHKFTSNTVRCLAALLVWPYPALMNLVHDSVVFQCQKVGNALLFLFFPKRNPGTEGICLVAQPGSGFPDCRSPIPLCPQTSSSS